MRKINKALLLTSMAVVTIGSVKIFNNNVMQKVAETNKTSIQAYNHNALNILDNIFEQNGMTILPFIFENTNQSITKEKVISDFASKGLNVTSITNKNSNGQTVTVKNNDGKEIVATGTEIRVSQNNTVYTVLVYGDVNRSGIVDLIDAQKIMLHVQNATKYPLNTIEFLAANVSNDDNAINLIDAQRLVMLKLGSTTRLVKDEPISLKESDKTPPVISINDEVITTGIQRITMTIGDTYTEPKVTATDNVDGNVTVKKSGDTVDTSRAGVYTVIYTASDAQGNTTIVKREITVNEATVNPPVESILSGIKIGDGDNAVNISELDLHIVDSTVSGVNEIDVVDGRIYTVVPVTFLDQNGNKIDLKEDDIQENVTTAQNGKLGIQLPKIKIPGQDASLNKSAISVKYYKDSNSMINKIGFSVSKEDIKAMDAKEILFRVGTNIVARLPVDIKYNIPATIELDTSIANIGMLDDIYTARKGQKFTLGVIKVTNKGDRPLLVENMVSIGGTGFTLYCNEYDEDGNIIVKGKITDTERRVYTVVLRAEIDDVTISTASGEEIKVQAFDVPDNIEFEDVINSVVVDDQQNNISLKISEEPEENTALVKLNMKLGTSVVNDLLITSKHTKITQKTTDGKDVDYLQIGRLRKNESGKNVPVTDNEKVEYISLQVNDTAQPGDIIITVTYYEGLQGLEKTEKFKVNISAN